MTGLLVALTLSGAALAGEGGVVVVPAGSTVTDAKGKPVATVSTTAFLLPEDYYDTALVKAKQLEVYRPAYEACMADMDKVTRGVKDALDSCIRSGTEDERLATDLYTRLREQEAAYHAERDKVLVLRSQRNTAWAVAGSIVLGAVATTAVVLAN
ncbi:MAG: hypothetical protein EBQ76_00090 [Betaproteobacteria bacterium]|nr:hypothetical protein [Betaproteobacteria bacterium]